MHKYIYIYLYLILETWLVFFLPHCDVKREEEGVGLGEDIYIMLPKLKMRAWNISYACCCYCMVFSPAGCLPCEGLGCCDNESPVGKRVGVVLVRLVPSELFSCACE